MELSQKLVGKFARVEFEDTGCKDGLIIGISDDREHFSFLQLGRTTPSFPRKEQLIQVGKRFKPIDTGLDKRRRNNYSL